ncbi:MAG TPA: hypothetical protein VGI64_15200 [Streptosporangiaceae bacterium]|jgi:hypothetical protein
MGVIALITWIITASGGLFLLAIWLIEYDREFQTAAATRLPVPVLVSHVLLALTGLVVWSVYLVADIARLAWLAGVMLLLVAMLGLVMAVRWIGVYRTFTTARIRQPAGDAPGSRAVAPPERNFPVPVVIGHGVFAVVTLLLVLLTALRA